MNERARAAPTTWIPPSGTASSHILPTQRFLYGELTSLSWTPEKDEDSPCEKCHGKLERSVLT